jgi:organic radical activating enzyme
MKGPFRVGLLLTKRCNIDCAHCWLRPTQNGADMPLDEAKGYIDQASDIPTLEWISFTGGEPFLLPRLLDELVGYASEKGLRTECVTNASWAETPEKAEDNLETLKGSGLENVRNGLEAAKRLGLRTVIMSTARKGSVLRLSEIVRKLRPEEIKILKDGKPTEKDSAIALESAFIPVGRGAELPREEWLIGMSPIEGPCPLVLKDIGIDTDGELLACCSAASIQTRGRLGNVVKTGLKELLADAWGQASFRSLAEQGPSSLADSLGIRWRDGFVSRCHLCHEILRDPRLDEILG